MEEKYNYIAYPSLLRKHLRFTRPGNMILKLCIYSGNKKINFWVTKLISNFNKYLRIKLPFCIIANFSGKPVFFNIMFSSYVSCRDERITFKTP